MDRKISNQKILSKFYDFVLDVNISARERKIGLMAKNDLEKGRYNVAVINQTVTSLQQEAMKNGLTPNAIKFYHTIKPLLNQLAPLGTNRGAVQINNSYLDD